MVIGRSGGFVQTQEVPTVYSDPKLICIAKKPIKMKTGKSALLQLYICQVNLKEYVLLLVDIFDVVEHHGNFVTLEC